MTTREKTGVMKGQYPMATADTLYDANRTVGPARLWILHREGHLASCYMMTSPAQTDIYVTYDGDRLTEVTFASMEPACAWAEEDRRTLVALGWRQLDQAPLTDDRLGVNSPFPSDARRA